MSSQSELRRGSGGQSLRSILVGSGLVVLVTWAVVDPFFMLPRIQSAAKRGDREALASLIDFPLVRENLKAAMNAHVLRDMKDTMSENPFGAIGLLLGTALVDRLVDVAITPEGLARLSYGQAVQDTTTGSKHNTQRIKQGYKSLNVFTASIATNDTSEAATFVFRRRGVGWVMTELQMPFISPTPGLELD